MIDKHWQQVVEGLEAFEKKRGGNYEGPILIEGTMEGEIGS